MSDGLVCCMLLLTNKSDAFIVVADFRNIKFSIGRYLFNVTTQTLSLGERSVKLSHFEAKILERLATNIGKTVDASELMIAVWQRDEPCNRNSLHGYIHKLRRALRHDPSISIINQRGFGYMLTINN